MLYRIARAVAEAFKFVALGGFIVAFFTAFAFVFILPIVPLFLIISAPFVLVLCWLTSDILSNLEQFLARRALRGDRCPACAAGIERFVVGKETVSECPACRRIYEADGDIWQRDPDATATAAEGVGEGTQRGSDDGVQFAGR
jgi:hypothetical protein